MHDAALAFDARVWNLKSEALLKGISEAVILEDALHGMTTAGLLTDTWPGRVNRLTDELQAITPAVEAFGSGAVVNALRELRQQLHQFYSDPELLERIRDARDRRDSFSARAASGESVEPWAAFDAQAEMYGLCAQLPLFGLARHARISMLPDRLLGEFFPEEARARAEQRDAVDSGGDRSTRGYVSPDEDDRGAAIQGVDDGLDDDGLDDEEFFEQLSEGDLEGEDTVGFSVRLTPLIANFIEEARKDLRPSPAA